MDAKTMYETYCEDSDWKNFQGNPCPQWDALPMGIQSHWWAVADAARELPDQFITARLKSMRERPRVWAYTKEAFAAQLALLYDMAALGYVGHSPSELMRQICCDGPSGHVDLTGAIDDTDETAEWCCAAVDTTRAAIDVLDA